MIFIASGYLEFIFFVWISLQERVEAEEGFSYTYWDFPKAFTFQDIFFGRSWKWLASITKVSSVVLQYRLYNSYGAVITPKPGMQLKETWIPGQARNDKIVKFILKHYTSFLGYQV